MYQNVLILEDDEDRRKRFETVARLLNLDVLIWHNAHEFVDQYSSSLADCVLFSLDCDLISPDGSDILGRRRNGRSSTSATQAPVAPVIVHSSNRDGSWRMNDVLTESGWSVKRVAPIGNDWIEKFCRMTVEVIVTERKKQSEA